MKGIGNATATSSMPRAIRSNAAEEVVMLHAVLKSTIVSLCPAKSEEYLGAKGGALRQATLLLTCCRDHMPPLLIQYRSRRKLCEAPRLSTASIKKSFQQVRPWTYSALFPPKS